jgi:hypothetical protein
MKVEAVILPAVVTDQSLKQYLADCSSVVRNKAPRDNDKLFERLLKESYGGKPSRVFEYIPCVVKASMPMLGLAEGDIQQLFGFFVEEAYFTNARELLNWGFSWNDIIPMVDFTFYRTVKVTAPYFIYGQLSTHTQITSVSHSARYSKADLGYWMPDEVARHLYETENNAQKTWNEMVEYTTPYGLEKFMKEVGVTRMEVYARGKDMLANRVYTLGGYINNPNSWGHFLNQRSLDKHTQLETRKIASMIYNFLG